MLSIIQTFLSNYVSAYRKLIENWKKDLDNNKTAGAAFYGFIKSI